MSKIAYSLVLALLVLLLSACGSDDSATEVEISAEASDTAELETDAAAEAPVSTSSQSASKVPSHMFLGTGSVQGVYFPIGGVICRLLNRHKALHRLRCTLESTGGSIYNLRELRAGNFDLVFAQSDWQFHAYHGSSTFKEDGPNPELRAVFALEADPLALIVQNDSEVQTFDDLADRVVSFGYSRSLQHRVINDYLAVKGWNDDNFKEVRRMSDTKQVGALCAGEVDAILLLSSSLTDHLKGLSEECKLRLLPIEGDEVKEVIRQKPYYRTGVILKGMHLDSIEDVMSFGLGATFVANESTSPKAIYHVVKEIAENFRDFKSLHPSLAALDKRELSYAGISIPLHPGAVRYYKEARLLKK